jgi:hypothetical protein
MKKNPYSVKIIATLFSQINAALLQHVSWYSPEMCFVNYGMIDPANWGWG